MTRRALEQLDPAPKIEDPNSDQHPFNRGLIWHDVGSISVFMFVDTPGVFHLDIWGQQPASDEQARAAFGVKDFNRYRQQAVLAADDRRIEEALTATQEPEPQVSELEAKKALARKLIKEQQRKVQAAADKALTRDLDKEQAIPHS
jgi:hypothetical protein